MFQLLKMFPVLNQKLRDLLLMEQNVSDFPAQIFVFYQMRHEKNLQYLTGTQQLVLFRVIDTAPPIPDKDVSIP